MLIETQRTLTARLHVVLASPTTFLATAVYVPASLGNASVMVNKCLLLPSTKTWCEISFSL